MVRENVVVEMLIGAAADEDALVHAAVQVGVSDMIVVLLVGWDTILLF